MEQRQSVKADLEVQVNNMELLVNIIVTLVLGGTMFLVWWAINYNNKRNDKEDENDKKQ